MRRLAILSLVGGLVMSFARGCASDDAIDSSVTSSPTVQTTSSTVARSATSTTSPVEVLLATTATALASWEELARRVEAFAEEALVQAEVIDAAMDELPDEALSESGWFEACCGEPRDTLLAILDRIVSDLEEADSLLAAIDDLAANEAGHYLTIARGGVTHAQQLLEGQIARAGTGDQPASARSMVAEGLSTIIDDTIVGCVRACIVE